MNLRRALGSGLQYFFVGLVAFVSVFPFIWMMVGATNLSIDIMAGKFAIGSALTENITKFFTLVDVPQVFWNSIKVAGLGTFFTIAIARSLMQSATSQTQEEEIKVAAAEEEQQEARK